MRQYNVEFFGRADLRYKHRDTVYDTLIDDDYISASTSTIEISSTDKVINGDYIYLTDEDIKFFGVVSDVSPGEFRTTVTFKPFISIFDEPFLFDTNNQGTSNTNHRTLEATIAYYISSLYVNPSDSLQALPIVVTNSVPAANQIAKWSLNLTPDTEGSHYCLINLYSVLIVNALKKYGISIKVEPRFSGTSPKIYLTIENNTASLFKIDANLDNVDVKTLKYNDRPTGVNKLIVYNTDDYTQSLTFYVHTDRTWDHENNRRIYPVVRECSSVAPNSEYEDPLEGFAVAAVDTAFSSLSGLEWDNLIELDTMINDPIVKPLDIKIGQNVSIWYKGGSYSSILTGRSFQTNSVTLLFGSERIRYSKRIRTNGG